MLRTYEQARSGELRPNRVLMGFDRLDLFDDRSEATISGLHYEDDFITESETSEALSLVDNQAWQADYQRRTQNYGRSAYRPSITGGTQRRPVFPAIMAKIAARLQAHGIFETAPQSVGVNEYLPGQGIAAHRDLDSDTIKTVAIVSLGSSAVMQLTRIGYNDVELYLRPLSLMVMQGEARTKWFHGIPSRKSDRIGGLILPRARRVSLIFRGA